MSDPDRPRDPAPDEPFEAGPASPEKPGERADLPPIPDPEGPFPDSDAGPPPSRDASARSGGAAGGPPSGETLAPPPAGGPAPRAGEHARPRGAHAEEPRRHDQPARSQLQEHLLSKTTWLRFLYIVLFLILWGLSRVVVGAVMVLQFLWLLFSGEINPRLTTFGQSLSTYSYEIVLYLTFVTDRAPFPFSDWPTGPPRGTGPTRPGADF